MELIEPLWTFAAEWKLRILVLIVLANMALAIRAFGIMAAKRTKAAKEKRVTVESYKATQNEPEDVAVYSRVVANQFETPVMFYALVAMSLALGVSSWLTVLLAAIFVILRFRHASEMWGAHNVLLRRKIFIRAFQVLMLMMVELAISTLLWA